jgi:phage FluMu protein gp41
LNAELAEEVVRMTEDGRAVLAAPKLIGTTTACSIRSRLGGSGCAPPSRRALGPLVEGIERIRAEARSYAENATADRAARKAAADSWARSVGWDEWWLAAAVGVMFLACRVGRRSL